MVYPMAAKGAPADSSPGGESIPDRSSGVEVPGQLLEKARLVNVDLYASLKSFVCQEEIRRFRGDLHKAKGHSIDHVSAHLSFENGVEHYSDIEQNSRNLPSISAIAGAWSEGEFGTLLQQTAHLLKTQSVSFISAASLEDTPAAIYRFDVKESESPWNLQVGPEHYSLSFTTEVWISETTGEILRINRRSTRMPEETGISEIGWEVTLDSVDLDGKTWRLPTEAAYSVSYSQSGHREWNQMSFSSYRRYGSESSLSFEGFQ